MTPEGCQAELLDVRTGRALPSVEKLRANTPNRIDPHAQYG